MTDTTLRIVKHDPADGPLQPVTHYMLEGDGWRITVWSEAGKSSVLISPPVAETIAREILGLPPAPTTIVQKQES